MNTRFCFCFYSNCASRGYAINVLLKIFFSFYSYNYLVSFKSFEAAIKAVEPSSVTPQALLEPSTQSKQIETPVQAPLFIPKVEESSTNESSTLTQRTVQFVRGDRVFNQKFGLGTVVAIKQYGGQVRELVIDFDFLPDEKTLVVNAVQLA